MVLVMRVGLKTHVAGLAMRLERHTGCRKMGAERRGPSSHEGSNCSNATLGPHRMQPVMSACGMEARPPQGTCLPHPICE